MPFQTNSLCCLGECTLTLTKNSSFTLLWTVGICDCSFAHMQAGKQHTHCEFAPVYSMCCALLVPFRTICLCCQGECTLTLTENSMAHACLTWCYLTAGGLVTFMQTALHMDCAGCGCFFPCSSLPSLGVSQNLQSCFLLELHCLLHASIEFYIKGCFM